MVLAEDAATAGEGVLGKSEGLLVLTQLGKSVLIIVGLLLGPGGVSIFT